MENEELIRQRMEQTRESLTEKLETLENKIVSTVHEATSAVSETVASVKESMHEGVETVKEAVDVRTHVERRPWMTFGASVLCGYVLGSLLPSEGSRRTSQIAAAGAVGPTMATASATKPQATGKPTPGNGHHKRKHETEGSTQSTVAAATSKAAEKARSWLSFLEPEINHLKGLALGVALGAAREMITSEVPPHMAERLRDIIDNMTEKIGGELVPPSDFEKLTSKHDEETTRGYGEEEPSRRYGELDTERPRW